MSFIDVRWLSRKTKHENQTKNFATNKVSDDLNNVNKLTPKIAFVGDVVVAINGKTDDGKKVEAGLVVTGKNWNPATTHVVEGANVEVAEATNYAYLELKVQQVR